MQAIQLSLRESQQHLQQLQKQGQHEEQEQGQEQRHQQRFMSATVDQMGGVSSAVPHHDGDDGDDDDELQIALRLSMSDAGQP